MPAILFQTVWVKEHKDCPAPLPVLVIVLIVIAGIVLLGLLLLLLWKLLTVMYDRREYARFEKVSALGNICSFPCLSFSPSRFQDRLNARWDTVCCWPWPRGRAGEMSHHNRF
jgi:hypothetical protein